MTKPSNVQLARLGRRLEGPLLIGRAAAGLVMVAMPDVVAGVWLGTRSPASRRFVRAIGVRDLVICVGQLRERRQATACWRRFAAAADSFDAAVAIGWAVTCRRLVSAAVAAPALGSALLTAMTAGSADPPVTAALLRDEQRA